MPVNVGQIVISVGANTASFQVETTRAQQLSAKSTGQIQGSLRKLSGAASGFGRAMQDGGAHAVSGMQATSAALRVLEGNMTNNLRAEERFLATTLNLGSVLKNALPVVGAIATLGVCPSW